MVGEARIQWRDRSRATIRIKIGGGSRQLLASTDRRCLIARHFIHTLGIGSLRRLGDNLFWKIGRLFGMHFPCFWALLGFWFCCIWRCFGAMFADCFGCIGPDLHMAFRRLVLVRHDLSGASCISTCRGLTFTTTPIVQRQDRPFSRLTADNGTVPERYRLLTVVPWYTNKEKTQTMGVLLVNSRVAHWFHPRESRIQLTTP